MMTPSVSISDGRPREAAFRTSPKSKPSRKLKQKSLSFLKNPGSRIRKEARLPIVDEIPRPASPRLSNSSQSPTTFPAIMAPILQ